MLLALLAAGPALADTSTRTIHSHGPITELAVGSDLSCQVATSGESGFEYAPASGTPGDCGTFLAVGGTVYGPDFASHPSTSASFPPAGYVPFTPVSQSQVTGSGSAAKPYTVTTVVTAGSTHLTLTETDKYSIGDESFRTDVTIANSGGLAVTGRLYRALHCDARTTGAAFGFVSGLHSPACTAHPGDLPPAHLDELFSISQGARYAEGPFSSVWGAIGSGASLPDTCACGTHADTAIALEYRVDVPADHTILRSLLENFSSTGHARGAPITATGQPTSISGTRATVTGTVNLQGSRFRGCTFEWGLTTGYGKRARCRPRIHARSRTVTVTATLTGLTPGRPYHYRLLTRNGVGPSVGSDVKLTRDR